MSLFSSVSSPNGLYLFCTPGCVSQPIKAAAGEVRSPVLSHVLPPKPAMTIGTKALVKYVVRQGCMRVLTQDRLRQKVGTSGQGSSMTELSKPEEQVGQSELGRCINEFGTPHQAWSSLRTRFLYFLQSLRMKLLIGFHGNRFELSWLCLPGMTWQVIISEISHQNFTLFIFSNFLLVKFLSKYQKSDMLPLKPIKSYIKNY